MIKSFENFINEGYQWYDLKFNSHKDHNPEADILEGHIDRNTLITYGIFVKGPKTGEEFMEYYTGPNYKPESLNKSSRSKYFSSSEIPAKYKKMWDELKSTYENDYEGGKSTSESVDEAMVQVAGKSKPSGAQVLATVIVDHLIERDFFKPGIDKARKAVIEDIKKVIIDSTF